MASYTDEAISVRVSQFLANPEDRLTLIAFLEARPAYSKPEDRLALIAFLEARPAYSKPTSYVSDLEQRLQLLRDIQQEYKKRNFELDFTAVLWSALIVVPLEQLRSLRDRYLNDSIALTYMLKGVASEIHVLLKVFLAKNPSQEELILAHVSKKRKRSLVNSYASLDEPDLSNSSRDKSESQKCEQRDKCCVVTSAANPDICHIFPFAAKKNPDRISSGLSGYIGLWDIQDSQRFKDLLVGDRNIVDTAANMVALQPLLHRWWGKAMIGFEPIEKIKKGIRLRVRWLPKTTLAMKEKVALDLNPLECLQLHSNQDGYVNITHSKTCRPIIDGTVIDITAQDDTAVPSWDLFSLQWDLIRMASLCGAAEASDDDDWESDDDDEAPQAKVARTTDDLYPDSPITALVTPGFQPLQSLPVQSLPVQSRESSPTKSLQPLRSLPVQSRESSPAKSYRGKVDENNPW